MVVGRDEVAEVARWAEGIERVHECIAGRFRRPEPRRRALEYLRGLLSPVERKNGWQLAEQAGDATPDGVQRLLYNYRWDADLVRDDLRDYVVEHLGDADGVLVVVPRPGFSRRAASPLGCSVSTAARRAGSRTARLAYSWPMPAPRAGRCWTGTCTCPRYGPRTGSRRREAGVPEDAVFRTKPQLAQLMLERAADSGVPFSWFTGDEVYGSDRKLRRWLEREEIPHVMAIKSNEKLWAWTEKGPLQVRADRLASGVEESAWVRCSAGNGAKGPRVYDWTAVEIRPLREPGKGHWLLARRSLAKPGELAYYVCFGPASERHPWRTLVRVAGTPVGHRGMLRGGQGRGGSGPVRGAAMGRLVPAHHPGDAGSRLPDGNQISGDGTGRKGGGTLRP